MPPSPPRLRRSPKREALHERSQSHTNEIASPTLRIVGDSDAKIYASTPFPTQESHLLSPQGRKPFEVGSVSRSNEPTPATTRLLLPSPIIDTSIPLKEVLSGQSTSFAHDGSERELSSSGSPSPSSRFTKEELSQSILSSSGQGVDRHVMDGGINHEETIPFPSAPSSRDGRDGPSRFLNVTTTSSHQNDNTRASLRAIASVASHLSLDSIESSDTVVRHRLKGPIPRSSYSIFPPPPRPGSSRSTRSFSTPPRPTQLQISRESFSPVSSSSPTSPVSPLSPESATFPTPERRVYSAPTYAQSDTSIANGIVPNVQFPRIRPPAASASFAAPGFTIPRRPVAMDSRAVDRRWDSHLSTIASEAADDRSDGSDRIGQPSMMDNAPSLYANRSSVSSASPPPVPPKSYARHTTIVNATVRPVEEEAGQQENEDQTFSRQTSRPKYFSFPSPHDFQPNDFQKRTSETYPGSRGSFLRDSIPTWARYIQTFRFSQIFFPNGRRRPGSVQRHRYLNEYTDNDNDNKTNANPNIYGRSYYANDGKLAIPARPDTASSQPPLSPPLPPPPSIPPEATTRPAPDAGRHPLISNITTPPPVPSAHHQIRIPRNRPRSTEPPHHHHHHPPPPLPLAVHSRDSLAITPVNDATTSHAVLETRAHSRPRHSPDWSPHLRHDRRSAVQRRTIYRAPSLNSEAEGRGFNRRNIQIWMFILGFVFPPAWIIASFLPLPPNVQFSPAPSSDVLAVPEIVLDIEKALGPIDQARFENARWWRVINRIMSLVGVVAVGAVIALIVVASRMRN